MLQDETIVTFTEAARFLPKLNGRRPHPSTLWRWARKGVSGVHLETRRIGSRFVTSVEALDRFASALATVEPRRAARSPRTVPIGRSVGQRDREVKKAAADCDKAGF